MSVRNITASLQQSRSALNHRSIDVAARCLLAGIWLERQFGNAPKILTTSATELRKSGAGAKVVPCQSLDVRGER
jgi:hypothetical protein